ncbi:host attachment protein [Thiorhodococcus minor]|uniref:Host attachment protein n=1 Tax=Thiorhodococcus minor TaxID=57489 RepID=A0A6M0JWX1_9GAMM|nr:host attachment protein [Thiorhodococcus minor]NEV60797.1 host attachment protein [Thiorhodococcus minor]
MKTRILVANAARARVLEMSRKHGPVKEIRDLVNPDERLHGRDLISDKPGRAFDKIGSNRHPMRTATGPKEQLAVRFAKRVMGTLETDLQKQRFDRLCLVAPPHFLGLLRKQMSGALGRSVEAALTKDLTREDALRVRAQVAPLL